jgi:hypothetical protein
MRQIGMPCRTDQVQAILDNRKTNHRIAIKPQPDDDGLWNHDKYPMSLDSDMKGWWGTVDETGESRQFKCPFGKVGDVLYVRETWRKYFHVDENGYTNYDNEIIEYAADNPEILYLMDGDGFQMYNKDGTEKFVPWRSRTCMPKSAARIWLEITDLKVERVRDITAEGAIAEGIEKIDDKYYKNYHTFHQNEYQHLYTDIETRAGISDPVLSFFSLWASIHGCNSVKGIHSFIDNPWVWAVSFKVLSTTGKPDNL